MRSGFVSIIGRPNVGKSTLLNHFVGEKIAAVSPRPQTTRNRLLGVRNSKAGEGGQIVFIDTPGIHKPHTRMHKRMVEIAMAALQGIDLVLLMVDVTAEFGAGDRFVLDALAESGCPSVLAINKIDLVRKSRALPLIKLYSREHPFSAIVPVSALKGDGLEDLERELLAALPEGKPIFAEDVLTDQPDLIGRGGRMLKKIGTAARKELEQILNAKIYLELWVKVKEGWREDDAILQDLGLE